MRRGRETADRLGNNPETGCWWVAHYDSLIGNGSMSIPADPATAGGAR
jgi:hypothetical protein